MPRLVVGITGATGAILGVRLLEALRGRAETHLVITKWGLQTILQETQYSKSEVEALASACYSPDDLGAAIASGSFLNDGMVVVPCSMRTLAAIATGNGAHLVHRAADVMLKERRSLVLVVRETPLSELHLENMLRLSRMGVRIFPPVPAFYDRPESVDDIIDHLVARIADQFGIHLDSIRRWTGQVPPNKSTRP